MSAKIYQCYQNIADNANTIFNHKIVLTAPHNGVETPKTLSLWGRIVQNFKDMFKKKEILAVNRGKVLENFKAALETHFPPKVIKSLESRFLDDIKKSGSSLRARQVRTILDNAELHEWIIILNDGKTNRIRSNVEELMTDSQ